MKSQPIAVIAAALILVFIFAKEACSITVDDTDSQNATKAASRYNYTGHYYNRYDDDRYHSRPFSRYYAFPYLGYYDPYLRDYYPYNDYRYPYSGYYYGYPYSTYLYDPYNRRYTYGDRYRWR